MVVDREKRKKGSSLLDEYEGKDSLAGESEKGKRNLENS
jgi:hypothetical protein